jgi:hypothetical protein
VADARVTQSPAQAATLSDNPAARPSQTAVQVASLSDNPAARPTQFCVMVAVRGVNAAIVTQSVVQVAVREVKGKSYGYIID